MYINYHRHALSYLQINLAIGNNFEVLGGTFEHPTYKWLISLTQVPQVELSKIYTLVMTNVAVENGHENSVIDHKKGNVPKLC